MEWLWFLAVGLEAQKTFKAGERHLSVCPHSERAENFSVKEPAKALKVTALLLAFTYPFQWPMTCAVALWHF